MHLPVFAAIRTLRTGHRAVALVVPLLTLVALAVVAMVASPASDPDRIAGGHEGRAFSDDSWWNTPLPDEAPPHPWSTEILAYLRAAPESGDGCLRLAGTGDSPWGQPIYEARDSDPEFDLRIDLRDRPPELDRLRIPAEARPARNSDASMTVYDRSRGYVVALTGARYDASEHSWTASGATVTYLSSNGLHVKTGASDDRRNKGTHRGNNGAVMAVTQDEVAAGVIPHVLKAAIGPEASHRHAFPMVGSDGDYRGDDPAVPPQGLRLRIKPSVPLASLHLHPDALVIAEALQRYGLYFGDSGGRTSLKLEDTSVHRGGVRWTVPDDALCALPFSAQYWDVIDEGYDPAAGPAWAAAEDGTQVAVQRTGGWAR